MPWLRQSTAATVKLGPFVDETDGKTAETGLTISQADIRISKAGGAFAQSNNSTGATHDENGYYGIPLDTTDTNTLGRLKVCVSESGALPVWQEFVVMPAVVYDSLVAGSDNLQVDVTQLAGVTQSLTDLKDFADDGYDPSTNKVQGVVLTDTVTTYTGNTPQTGDTYARIGANGSGLTALGDTRLAELEAGNLPTDIANVKSDTAAILDDTGTSGVALPDGVITAAKIAANAITAAKIATDAIDADALAADAVTEIQNGLATAAALAVVAGYLDTEVAAIKAKTDNLPASPAATGDIPTLAQINAEVDTALADINLDHLVKSAVDTDFPTTVHLNSVVGHLADNGTAASFSRTTDSLEAIRDRGDAAWLTGGGVSGSNSVTFTVRDSVSLTPLNDQAVVIYAADGTTLVDAKRTNASGQAVFSLDSANYYYALPPSAGYSSVSNTALTVDGVETVTVGKVAISSASTAPGTRVVRCIVRGADGELKSGVVVSATLQSDPSTVDQAVLSRQKLTDTTDANGIADLTCITSDQFTNGTGVYVFNVPNGVRVESAVAAGSGVVYLEDLVA